MFRRQYRLLLLAGGEINCYLKFSVGILDYVVRIRLKGYYAILLLIYSGYIGIFRPVSGFFLLMNNEMVAILLFLIRRLKS